VRRRNCAVVPPYSAQKLRLVHRLFGPGDPETPLFNRSKVEKKSIDPVCNDSHEESTDSIDNVMVGGSHNNKKDEERVSEGDCSDRFVGRVDEEGQANNEGVSEVERGERSELVLKLTVRNICKSRYVLLTDLVGGPD
jgi:hypothetical protein